MNATDENATDKNIADEQSAAEQEAAEQEAAEQEAAEQEAAKQTRRPTNKSKKAKYVKIRLEESEEIPPSGLFIGVNDRSYLLQPGVDAMVPQGVVDVLDNAVMSTPRIDPQTKRVVGYKDRLRYPYRRL